MKRRNFLKYSTFTVPVLFVSPKTGFSSKGNQVMTVTGPIDPEKMGMTLIHEHVLADFAGWQNVGPHRYDENHAFNQILPYLIELNEKGFNTFVECTPNYIGRNVRLLRKLSKASGLHIISNTGIYAAVNFKFVPSYVKIESAEKLAARWVNEWEWGIGHSTIKPGFIKTGVNSGEFSDVEVKLLNAAALTHKATGLTIACHSGQNSIEQEMDILEKQGVAYDALVWTHAQNDKDIELYEMAAKAGVWLSLDGIRQQNMNWYLDTVIELKKRGLLNRVLLSHDAGWYRPEQPDGENFRDYTLIADEFIPQLKENGFNQDDISQIFISNPQKAFMIKKRIH